MITHRINRSLGIAIVTWRGQILDSDIEAALRAFFEDPAWEPGCHALIDVREADLAAVTSRGLRFVAAAAAGHVRDLEGKEFKTAILASDDAVFGLGRMYEAYTAESPETVQVFRDLQQALSWLGAPADLIE